MKYWITKEQLQEMANAENGNQIFVLCHSIARKQKLDTRRTESLTKGLVLSLVKVADVSMSRPVHLQKECTLTKNQYNNFQKLRYHGLVESPKTGYYSITQKGLDFLHGESVPKSVEVEDNHTIDVSKNKVRISDFDVTSKWYPSHSDYIL